MTNGQTYRLMRLQTATATTVDLYSVSLPAQSGIVYVEGEGWTVTGNSRPTNIQIFSASGTWNKPTSFNPGVVMARVWGAGGGGGGGSSLATATVTKGGGGGGGGCFVERIFRASDLGDTVSVTIGAGGSAGTGATAGGSGGDGGVGGNTTFGALLTGYGGGGFSIKRHGHNTDKWLNLIHWIYSNCSKNSEYDSSAIAWRCRLARVHGKR